MEKIKKYIEKYLKETLEMTQKYINQFPDNIFSKNEKKDFINKYIELIYKIINDQKQFKDFLAYAFVHRHHEVMINALHKCLFQEILIPVTEEKENENKTPIN